MRQGSQATSNALSSRRHLLSIKIPAFVGFLLIYGLRAYLA